MVAKITRNELKAKIDSGERFYLVEALPEKYYRDAHLPGALHMPHDQVAQLARTLLPDKDRDVVVYCANAPCRNSTIAAAQLQALSYVRVLEYVEGKQDWVDAGFPIERDTVSA